MLPAADGFDRWASVNNAPPVASVLKAAYDPRGDWLRFWGMGHERDGHA
jgi:hypothetical protein